jgi:hypothetical protein
MNIADAQKEIRLRFAGGYYGQLVSGILWLTSAILAECYGARVSIGTIVIGGFFIFPVTELLVRMSGGSREISRENSLRFLGMQVAFVLPLSMPLLLPVTLYRVGLFFPALMILLGAHYVPFVFLYGMRMFAVLAGLLIGGGVVVALSGVGGFGFGAWYTGILLLLFAFLGRACVKNANRGANLGSG